MYSITYIHKFYFGWIFPLEVYKSIVDAPEQAPISPSTVSSWYHTNMGLLYGPNKAFGNFTFLLFFLLILLPSSKGGFFNGLKRAWHNLVTDYPFTSTIQFTSHVNRPLAIACVLDEGIRKVGKIRPGQTFSFEFQERSMERNHMTCFLWQRGKEIGWFHPLYYGTSPCKQLAPNIWSKSKKLCKRQLYSKHVTGAVRYNGEIETFIYAPMKDKWWSAVFARPS